MVTKGRVSFGIDQGAKLEYNPQIRELVLDIDGPPPLHYRVSTREDIDQHLSRCAPEHVDILLDARNYLYPIEG